VIAAGKRALAFERLKLSKNFTCGRKVNIKKR
jgi:hypothetical protein